MEEEGTYSVSHGRRVSAGNILSTPQ